MSLINKISAELAPFFKYAKSENPSTSIRTWKDSLNKERIHSIYQNCVTCNTKRFTSEELGKPSLVRLGTDTYFCKPCAKEVGKLVAKYDIGIPSETQDTFGEVWNDKLFASSKL